MPSPAPNPHDAGYWRHRAEEARTIAGGMPDGDARKSLLVVAKGYDQLAESADRIAAGEHVIAAGEGGRSS